MRSVFFAISLENVNLLRDKLNSDLLVFSIYFLYFSYIQTTVQGMSGPLELDKDGQRTDFALNILELKKNGFEKVSQTQLIFVSLYFSPQNHFVFLIMFLQ